MNPIAKAEPIEVHLAATLSDAISSIVAMEVATGLDLGNAVDIAVAGAKAIASERQIDTVKVLECAWRLHSDQLPAFLSDLSSYDDHPD